MKKFTTYTHYPRGFVKCYVVSFIPKNLYIHYNLGTASEIQHTVIQHLKYSTLDCAEKAGMDEGLLRFQLWCFA